MAERCQSRIKCGCADTVMPERPPVSAVKGKSSLRRSRTKAEDEPLPLVREGTWPSSSSSPRLAEPRLSFRPLRFDQDRVARNLQKVRRVALEAVGELNHFRVFVKRCFATSSEAFEWLAGNPDAREIDSYKFKMQLERRPFTGQSERVFYSLCEDIMQIHTGAQESVLRRERFMNRLRGLGAPFRTVVRLAIASKSFGIPFKALDLVDQQPCQKVKQRSTMPGPRRMNSLDSALKSSGSQRSTALGPRRMNSLDSALKVSGSQLAQTAKNCGSPAGTSGGSPDDAPLPKTIKSSSQPKKRRSFV